jgi:thioredoxin reductase
MHDLIVIGGGPAGLAATAYALGKGLDVLLIGTTLGGRAAGAICGRRRDESGV